MKSWTCSDHGEFSAPISICPVCKKRSKRNGLKEIIDSGTPPSQTRASFKKTNELMDTTLRAQNMTNYSNATGYGNAGKATFANEYQHDSGLMVGYGMDFLQKYMGGSQLAQVDLEAVRQGKQGPEAYNPVDVKKLADWTATVPAGSTIGSASHIRERTNVIAKDRGEYR